MRVFLNQFFRFALVGLSGTAVQYLSLWIGVEWLGSSATVASAVGYILGSIVNYILNYLFTFQSDASHRKTAPRYVAILAIGWSLNAVLMWLFAERWHWNYFLAQICTTGIGFFWNFSASRWWAFKAEKV